jgi:hypothetical protein
MRGQPLSHPMRKALVPTVVSFLTVIVSCDDDPERRTLRDTGAACVNGPAFGDCTVRSIASGEPLRIDVDFATCTSSSCDTVLNAACHASRSGSIITVEAEAVIETQGNECTDDCGFVTASCELEALPEGTYELRYGDETTTLTVPSTTAAACTGRSLAGRCCDTSADCGGGACQNQRCQ